MLSEDNWCIIYIYCDIREKISLSRCNKELEKMFILNKSMNNININEQNNMECITDMSIWLRRAFYWKFYNFGAYDGIYLKCALKDNIYTHTKEDFVNTASMINNTEFIDYSYINEQEKAIYSNISNKIHEFIKDGKYTKDLDLCIDSNTGFNFVPFIIDRLCPKKILHPPIKVKEIYTEIYSDEQTIENNLKYYDIDSVSQKYVIGKVNKYYAIHEIDPLYLDLFQFEHSSCLTNKIYGNYFDTCYNIQCLDYIPFVNHSKSPINSITSFIKSLISDISIEVHTLSSFYKSLYNKNRQCKSHFSSILSFLKTFSDTTYIIHSYNTDSQYVGIWWIIGCFERWIYGFTIMAERDS